MSTKLLRLLLCLSLLWTSMGYAASAQLVNPGRVLTFGDGLTTAGDNVAMIFSNVGGGTGRYSDRFDLGAGAHPAWFELRCWVSLTGTLTLGMLLEYYVASSDGTNNDAGWGTTATTMTSDHRYVITLAGIARVYQTTQNTTMYFSWRNIYLPSRYGYVAFWNATGISTETSTSKHRCTLTATTPEMQ